jgi:hypothetical protein
MRRARSLFDLKQVFGEPFQHLLLHQGFVDHERRASQTSGGRLIVTASGGVGRFDRLQPVSTANAMKPSAMSGHVAGHALSESRREEGGQQQAEQG